MVNFTTTLLQFSPVLTLPGHEDWIRGLEFALAGKYSLIYEAYLRNAPRPKSNIAAFNQSPRVIAMPTELFISLITHRVLVVNLLFVG